MLCSILFLMSVGGGTWAIQRHRRLSA
jgi:hypothetical protein